ncbi:indolepyruvate oxidoreductase subunit beta [Patescibacteria group bacterium]|nr:indolepyruvate oxidoreductase subunit beta [Patescibacteria group bacterium]
MGNKTFNIVITGTGGQGLITLLQIVAEAATIEGFDVKTAELHGLSQRGGSVNTHIRIGEKVYSPLVPLGSADLILSLEYLETLRAIPYSNSKTTFLINCYSLPFVGTISEKEIDRRLSELIKSDKIIIAASEVCRKELGKDVLGGIYLISYAAFKGLLPIKPESIKKAIARIIPKKYLDINQKAYKLAKYAN